MGKIVVYPRHFKPPELENRYPYTWDIPAVLVHQANAKTSRIVQQGERKCSIPALNFEFSEDLCPIQFEMTWKEAEELSKQLQKLLREHSV